MRTTPSVVLAIKRELKELDTRVPGMRTSALAVTALAMARELDNLDNPASGMAACSRVLSATMGELHLHALQVRAQSTPTPPQPETRDGVDEIAAKRRDRRAET